MKKYIIFILLSLASFSCEINISDRFRDLSDRMIVLNGQLMPDSIPRIYLSRTLSMVETDSIIALTDAEVKLSVNGQSYYFTGGDNGIYTCEDYIPVAGDQVRIDCKTDGLQDAGASSIIMGMPEVLDMQYSVDENYELTVDITLSDLPESADYYSLKMEGWRKEIKTIVEFSDTGIINYTDTANFYGTYYIQYPDSLDKIILNDHVIGGNDIIFTDQTFNGQEKTLQFSVNLIYVYNDTIPEINICFFKRDEAYYRYIESFLRYNPNANIPIIQPVQIYTNIEDGMGLLISADEKKWTIDMSEYYNDPGFLEALNGK